MPNPFSPLPVQPGNSHLDDLLRASLAGFPPAFGAEGLAHLLDKSVAAILADRSRAPHKLPPACLPPGTQKPIWLLADVVDWLAKNREQPKGELPKTKRRGRPTKVEQQWGGSK